MNRLLANLLINKLTEHTNKNRYIQQVAIWVAEILLSETKTEITFEYDSPWDSSGITLKTEQCFDIKDYTSLDSFINNEYNGSSQPSFISGNGLFHNVYASELEQFTTEWISMQLAEIIDKLLEMRNSFLIEYTKLREIEYTDQSTTAAEIVAFLYDEDTIGDFLISEFPMELLEEIGRMDINLLFKIGQKRAQENLRHNEIKRQERIEELTINYNKNNIILVDP